MQKANKLGAHYALILGTSEVEAKQVTVKDLRAGTQEVISRDALKTYNFK